MAEMGHADSKMHIRTILFTILALLAFAANSIICRAALKDQTIDPGSFTMIRLLSGAIVLLFLIQIDIKKKESRSNGSWSSAFILFAYATAFSFAYVTLDTATGAVIAFGAVQITMITASIIQGHHPKTSEWIGILVSISGFLYLLLPGASSPSLKGFILMTASGICWGLYTLKGRNSENPLRDTAYNFTRTIPFLFMVLIFSYSSFKITLNGFLLAVFSGAITSGLGYTIWYVALRGLRSIQASIVQLLVPVIAALGGFLFLGETINSRVFISSLLILGGIFLLIKTKNNSSS